MAKIRWTGGTFTDGARGFRTTGGVHEFDDPERVEEYLDHRSGNWERVEEDDEADSETSEETDSSDDQDAAEPADEEEDEAAADETDEDDSEPEIEGESGTPSFNPENHTNSEIEERVADIDDEAALVALRNLEEEQQDRKGAKGAIDDRLNEIREG